MTQRQPIGNLHHAEHLLARKHLLIFLALILLALCALQAHAAERPIPSGVLTPSALMERGEARFRALQDYNCRVELEAKQGNRVQTGTCQFWFKQPRMLRMKVISGSRAGSEVAVDSRGQIHGRKRGVLGFIVKRLQPSDPRLLTIHGSSMMGLDWGSFFLKYHAAALRPAAQVAVAPRDDAAAPYQVQVSYPDRGMRVREVYSLDPQQWLIVEGAVYENQTRVEHVVFRDIQVNTGISDAWFSL